MSIVSLASGNWHTQMLYTLCRLNIPEYVPNHIDTISSIVSCNSDYLYRLIRALTTLGIFTMSDDKYVSHTNSSLTLLKSHISCMRAFCILRGSPYQYNAWSNLLYAIQNGESAFKKTHNMTMFQYLDTHTEDRDVFQDAMTSITLHVANEISSKHIDVFSNNSTIIDIGGGVGTLLKNIDIIGTKHVFDLPSVVSTLQDDDIQYIGGNFFTDVIPYANTYILKYILHDWSDDKCIQILENIVSSMNDESNIIVIESLMNDTYHKMLDIQMMVCLDNGARERTYNEYVSLFNRVGLHIDRCISLETFDLSMMILSK